MSRPFSRRRRQNPWLDSWHQDSITPSVARSLFFSLFRPGREKRPLCHFLRTPRRCFVDKLLSARRWRIFDESPRIPRFRRFQSRRVTKNVNSGPRRGKISQKSRSSITRHEDKRDIYLVVDSRDHALYTRRGLEKQSNIIVFTSRVRYRVAWIRVRLKIYRVLVVHFLYSLYIRYISTFCEIHANT